MRSTQFLGAVVFLVLTLLLGPAFAVEQPDLETRTKADSKTCRDLEVDADVRLDACQRAIASGLFQDYDLARLYQNLGWALDDLGDPRGLEDLKTATEIDPTTAAFWRSYGCELGDRAQWDELLEIAEKAIDVDPSHANGYDLRG